MSPTNTSSTTSSVFASSYDYRKGLKFLVITAVGAVGLSVLFSEFSKQSKINEKYSAANDTQSTQITNIKANMGTLVDQVDQVAASIPQLKKEQEKRVQNLLDLQKTLSSQLKTLGLKASSAQVDRDHRMARLAQFTGTGKRTRADLDSLRMELAAWNALLLDPIEHDPGQGIPADEAGMAVFVGLQETRAQRKQQLEADLRGWQQQVDLRLQSVDDATDKDIEVRPEYVTQLEQIDAKVVDAVAELRNDQSTIHALFVSSPKAPPGSVTPTLEEAIAACQKKRAAERAAFAKAASRQAEEAYRKRLAEQTAQYQEKLAELRLANEHRMNELKLKKEQADAEIAAQKKRDAIADAKRAESQRIIERDARIKKEDLEKNKAKLVREFEREYPLVRDWFIPMTSAGYMQPMRENFSYFKRTTVKGPVSLRAIKSEGFLRNTVEDQKAFHASFSSIHSSQHNDRPLGAFPRAAAGNAALHTIAKIQEFLRKYGAIMVEKGLLAP